jgi:hypothetical protein
VRRPILSLCLASAAWVFTACGGDGKCDPNNPKDCDTGLVCEQVQGQEQARCFAPVQVQGRVFNLSTGEGIANAVVAAVDTNGSPVGSQSVSGADGSYSLPIPSVRADEKGAPMAQRITLRAAAKDHLPFPSGIRVSLPVSTEGAARAKPDDESQPLVVKSGLTDVGLVPLPDAERGQPSIAGTVDASSQRRGVLVVAQSAADATARGYSAVADSSGAFRIFNVPPGQYTVQAYTRGSNYTAATATVEAGKDTTGVQVKRSEAPTATLNGSVSIVATTGGQATSVVMVVESTFNTNLVRGEVPPGLRAPEPGTAPNITNTFSLEGVPDGRYVVLAAFENDGLVRDPDPGISGTQIQRVTVTNGTVSSSPAFKVTGAVSIVGPGAGETIEDVTGTPRFTWKPYSSSQAYDVSVFDSFGNEVWKTRKTAVTGSDNTLDYAGTTALKPGNVYQWRVTALGNQLTPKSQSEDLRGLFRVQ